MLSKIILYKYFLCVGKIKPADMKWAVEFHKEHRIDKGKFWCWHHWNLFEVVPSGTFSVRFGISKDVICSKCGKVAQRYPDQIDDRLIDYNRRVVYG